jgi:ABC-type glycerol-3-phosphate transport system permease component
MKQARVSFAGLPIHVVLIIAALVNLFPVYYMVLAAFKDELELLSNPFGLPRSFDPGNFVTLFVEKGFARLFLNSILVAVISVTFALAISCLAAYAFARFRFAGRQILFNIITALMAIPPVVVVVPLFVVMARLKLLNQYPSVVIIYTGFILPFSIFLLTGFFRSIPEALTEAAKIDGASDLQVLRSVILPLAKAPLVTLFLVNGLWVWNELMIAVMFLQKEEMRTLMAGMAFLLGRNVRQLSLLMAASVLASVPMFAVLIAGQRAFVKGLTAGAVK